MSSTPPLIGSSADDLHLDRCLVDILIVGLNSKQAGSERAGRLKTQANNQLNYYNSLCPKTKQTTQSHQFPARVELNGSQIDTDPAVYKLERVIQWLCEL